jgi:threonine/homoserine/homoserine lactone efflux protein
MTLHNYLLFVGSSIVLVLVPGPDMIYMLGRCVAQGRKAGVMAAIGFNLGGYAHLAAAAVGLTAVLATSATAFTAVKWVGAAYLIYLGVSAIKSTSVMTFSDAHQTLPTRRGRTILWQAFLSDVLNPKVAMFFLALLPQFVSFNARHPTLQLLALGVTLNVIALTLNFAIVLLSAKVTQSLRKSRQLSLVLQKAMGAMFIALGLRLATDKL